MITEKKFLPKIHIYNANNDITKRWFVYWYEDGKRIRKYDGINGLKTVAERSKALQELSHYWTKQLKGKIEGFPNTIYFKQYKAVQKYLDMKANVWRSKTVIDYRSKMDMFFRWNERKRINGKRIEAFIQHLWETGRAQNTVRAYYLALRNILGNSIEESEDWFKDIFIKKKVGVPARYFSKVQINMLSREIPKVSPELWLAVRFIFYCFIRPGELRQLRVSDVVLEEAKICIPAEISKNRKTQYVAIPEAFLNDLEQILIERNPSAFLIGGQFRMVGKNWMRSLHQTILKNLHFDIKHYKLYSWKHTGAVVAVKSGVHIKQLQMQLRHHSLDQVNQYLRQMGIFDMDDFSRKMPKI